MGLNNFLNHFHFVSFANLLAGDLEKLIKPNDLNNFLWKHVRQNVRLLKVFTKRICTRVIVENTSSSLLKLGVIILPLLFFAHIEIINVVKYIPLKGKSFVNKLKYFPMLFLQPVVLCVLIGLRKTGCPREQKKLSIVTVVNSAVNRPSRG